MKILTWMPRLEGYRFPREVVAYAVSSDHRFALSTAEVEALLPERDVTVSWETLRNWLNRVGKHFADCIKRDRPTAADKWHLDEAVDPINLVFRPRRYQLSAISHRHARADAFDLWKVYAAEMTA